MLSVWQF